MAERVGHGLAHWSICWCQYGLQRRAGLRGPVGLMCNREGFTGLLLCGLHWDGGFAGKRSIKGAG